jgi:hypothetical protein
MNLRRQLLLVSLLTLVLPWAGCQFIRETESALREGQQHMLSGTAVAIADSLAQFPDEFSIAAPTSQFGETTTGPFHPSRRERCGASMDRFCSHSAFADSMLFCLLMSATTTSFTRLRIPVPTTTQ